MIDEELLEKAYNNTNEAFLAGIGAFEQFLELYLSYLPKPSMPYDQAIAYRKLVGME